MLARLIAIAALVLVACAGGESTGDDADAAVDAAPAEAVDARAGSIDARPADADAAVGSALGEACGPNRGCPASAPLCLAASPTSARGYCSLICAEDFEFTTTAQGGIPALPGAAADARCTAGYTGDGTPACAIVEQSSVAPPFQGQPAPNTMYTADFVCGIRCGSGGACPEGMRCGTRAFCEFP